ncbi:MAG: 50S ribosomal protein L23 [Thermoplasmata archaeon]|nr:50S ribosomal protein L23 [Candidatus Sysuiplasma acidicola]MBX8637751.1 50S ribosomal protein L23 [Candidatus Sysuiplasma acidicola]MBX8646615.1 50S ribosomal protein L23 [Candidatus Sysuiplasma acidicola]
MDEYSVLIHPYVTEKSMNAMSGTAKQKLRDGNRLEFVVRIDATKEDIRKAFEKRFEAEVEKINVKIRSDGKHAIIKLKEEYSAEDIGVRIGVI